MPTPSNITLRVTRNGGAPETGGIAAAYSDSCVLSLADPSSVNKCLYEVFDYPAGFACPAGWSTSGSGVYYYNSPGGAAAPAFSLPSAPDVNGGWGDFLLRATVNDGQRQGSGEMVSAPDLIDERTALRILSPRGLADVGYLAGSQFDAQRKWVGSIKQLLRAIDGGGVGGTSLGVTIAISQGNYIP
jgi:hypothetical protein